MAFTSVLKRAIKTLWLVLEEMDRMWIPIRNSWKLNERHYGGLQGLNKAETAAKYGDEQVRIWRRSYDVLPPLLDKGDERYPGRDPRYAGLGPDDEVVRLEPGVREVLNSNDWKGLTARLSELSPVVSAFFEDVMVMDPDEKVWANRLALLRRCNALFEEVGDLGALRIPARKAD